MFEKRLRLRAAPLGRGQRARLARSRRLALRIALRVTDPSGRSQTLRSKVTLRPPASRRR